MKVVLGYIIRIICVFLFLMIFLSAINNFFYEKHEAEIPGYLIGYYLGTFFGFVIFSWLIYKLYKFGGKLIKKSKNKNDISEIGQEQF